MFQVLPGSLPAPRSPTSGMLAAVVSHAAVVAIVLVSHAARGEQQHPVIIIGTDLWPAPTPVTAPHLPGAPIVGGPVLQPDLSIVDVPGMPPIESAITPVGAPSGSPVGAVLPGDGGVWDSGIVDERPEVLSGPILTYPELMRQAGIEGRVVVEVVIDSLGRAELGSLRIVESPQRAFEAPALSYVRRALFRPARVMGRSVRVLVRLPIDFRITR